MLQQDEPEDYVIATGESRSVQDFLETAFDVVEMDAREFLVVDESLYRPSEVNVLRGDASKAWKKLGWKPIVSFHDLVKEMVESDLAWHSKHGTP